MIEGNLCWKRFEFLEGKISFSAPERSYVFADEFGIIGKRVEFPARKLGHFLEKERKKVIY